MIADEERAGAPSHRRSTDTVNRPTMMQQYADQVGIQPEHPGLEAMDDGFFAVDAAWRIVYWNASAERFFGINRADLLGRELWLALPFFDNSLNRGRLQRAATTGIAQRYLNRFSAHVDGALAIRAAPMGGGGVAVHFHDGSSEIQQAEQYSALLETIQNGFVAVDKEWRIVYMNSVAESLLRLRRERAMNVLLWSFLPEGPPEIAECLRSTMADGLKRHLSGLRPQGRVFRGRAYDLWTYPLAGGGISIMFEDVSDRVGREETLERLASEARDASRAKSRFFAAVSHELRTPLNAIVGYTHLLETGTYGLLPAGALRAAERAAVCAEHLSRLVDDLLLLTASEVSRIGVTIAPVDLDTLLESAAEPYRLQAESKGLEFDFEIADDLPPLETDRERLRQILASVLANAVRYTQRGRIVIAAATGAEGFMEISVRDTGPGIALADQERIFGPFEQVGDTARSDPLARGSGLGLTVARQLAVLLQGTLELSETSAEGSCFRLRIPLVHDLALDRKCMDQPTDRPDLHAR